MMEKYNILPGFSVYFITHTVVDWLPIFTEESTCRILCDSMNYCIQEKNLRVNAYVIMPNHFHAIVFNQYFENEKLKQSLDDFRKFTGRKLADYCDTHFPSEFGETFRRSAGEDRQRRIWQPTQHFEGIGSDHFWMQKANYIHENPVRKGLVLKAEDWRFSSARFCMEEPGESQDIQLCEIGW